MKKFIAFSLAILFVALFVACDNKTQADNATATVSPSPSASVEVDSLLANYDTIVTKYLADTAAKDAAAVSEGEAKIAEISPALADAATKFTPEQLAKYNEISARLNN